MPESSLSKKRDLPKISDLDNDESMIIKDTELAIILNSEPQQSWVKTLQGFRYLPIERVEYLLTRIFGRWKVEIKESKLLANSVIVTIRLWYVDPITNDWQWQDGIGASPLQTDKGKGAIEFDFIKNNAVMLAAPAAESYAVKDAAEKLGKLFGKDLNRKDEIGYESLIQVNETRKKQELIPEHPKWKEAIAGLKLGSTTIEQIKYNFELSEINQQKLIDEAI